MKRLIALATKQAKERLQFGQPIAEFGLIKQKVGHMVVDCYATESVVSMVAGLIDQGYEDYAVEAAITKVFATEALWRTADEALQIAGGNGYMREFPYERALRDCRINRIFEGTNEILRLFIALTAMNDVGAQLKELAGELEGRLQRSHQGLRRALATTRASGPRWPPASGAATGALHPARAAVLKAAGRGFEERTRDLATAADRILRKHGKRIIGKQFATRRLADIMIDLFVLSCVLSRVNSAVRRPGRGGRGEGAGDPPGLRRPGARRVRSNCTEIDDNDDELVKLLADHAFAEERYSWDNLPT